MTKTKDKDSDKDRPEYDVKVVITYSKKDNHSGRPVEAVVGFASYETEFYVLLISIPG